MGENNNSLNNVLNENKSNPDNSIKKPAVDSVIIFKQPSAPPPLAPAPLSTTPPPAASPVAQSTLPVSKKPLLADDDLISSQTQSDFFPPKSRKSVGKIISISILCVIVLTVGAIASTELGVKTGLEKYYNRVGAERLWGGMPYDGKRALVKSASKMAEVTKYQMDSQMKFNATMQNGGGFPFSSILGKNAPLVLESAPIGKVLGINSYALTSPITTPSQSISATLTAKGKFSDNSQDSTISLASPLLGQYAGYMGLSSNITQISLGIKETPKKIYIRTTNPKNSRCTTTRCAQSKWFEFNKTGMGNYSSVDTNYARQNLDSQLKGLSKFDKAVKYSKRVATEDINGIKTAKYETEIDPVELSKILGAPDSDAREINQYSPKIVFSTWIGKKDYYIYKMALNISFSYMGSSGDLSFDVNFSNFNQDFAVTAPTTGEIDSRGISGLIDDFTGSAYTQTRLKASDTQRKSNARMMVTANEVYYDDNNSAYPKSKNWCTLSSSSCALNKLFVGGQYISSGFAETLDKSLYSYKSTDGQSCEVRVELQANESASSNIIKSGGKTYFSLKCSQ